jgi:hypothetical protein
MAVLRPRTSRVFPGSAALQRGCEAGLGPDAPSGVHWRRTSDMDIEIIEVRFQTLE